ncbi:hypothetical protein [Mangrovimonas sp. YM274]|uniref:hypothetical protein n=1 Tax=Mangrovimonas sp. YM274 TaxID=3070660 RepID=UPI0027DD6BBD|nr:hypothetical protein [Mangrovimonas sp. YM274]WMI68241.1 hypothetical protein RBH95_13960 [Mangrovimonas sp. YM274]
MSLKEFITSEYKDRLKNKHFAARTWNFVFFPITVGMNYRIHKKWIEVLNQLELTENDLGQKTRISLSFEKMGFFEKANLIGETSITEKINSGFVVVKNEMLVIFPFHSPEPGNIHQFFTQMEKPIIICPKEKVHPFRTILKLPTFDKIEKLESNEKTTRILLKDRTYDKSIELKINKKIQLPTPCIAHCG